MQLQQKKATTHNRDDRDETSSFHLIFSIAENSGEKFSQAPQLPVDGPRNIQKKNQPCSFKALHD